MRSLFEVDLRGHSRSWPEGEISSLAFSFLSVIPTPVTAFPIELSRCSAQCTLGASGRGGPGAGFKPGPCVTLAKLPDFSVHLSGSLSEAHGCLCCALCRVV